MWQPRGRPSQQDKRQVTVQARAKSRRTERTSLLPMIFPGYERGRECQGLPAARSQSIVRRFRPVAVSPTFRRSVLENKYA